MDPSNIPWLTQPDLFLLSQGGVAQVWKCKRTISEALLMERKDFVYVDDVENHLDLIKPTLTQWDEVGYKELVKYISEWRLLVNGQGLVIAELPKFSLDDGKMDESVSPLFMWSLDILALDTYMQHYMVRPIPFKPIQYLEDKNGPARDVQEVELSPNEVKLTKDLEKENNDKKALDKEVTDLNITKKGLVDQVAKLEKDLAAKTKEADAEQQELDRVKSQLEGRVTDLEGKNKNLDGRIAQLTAELADLRRRIAELQQQLIRANNDKDALDRKIAGLQDQLDTLIKNKSKRDDSWWNDNHDSNWVDFYYVMNYCKRNLPIPFIALNPDDHPDSKRADHNIYEVTQENTNYFRDDKTTNCGTKLFCGVRNKHTGKFLPVKVAHVFLLGPSTGFEKARFDRRIWNFFELGKGGYVTRSDDGYGRDW